MRHPTLLPLTATAARPGAPSTRREWLMRQGLAALGAGLPGAWAQGAAGEGTNRGPAHWAAAWAAAERDRSRQLVAPGLGARPPLVLHGQTVRLRVQVAMGGTQWRVRLTNRWGLEPLAIDAATLALATGGAALSPRSVVALRFGGQPGLTLAPGATQWSDAAALPARAGQALAVSFHLPRPYTVAAGYPVPRAAGGSWLLPGAQSAQPAPRDARPLDWAPALAGIDVLAPPATRVLVAFGDSLTDGTGAGDTGLGSYPLRLAARLRGGQPPVSVVNTGIGGNRLLQDGAGEAAVARFARDVLAQSGVTHTLVLIGINDLNFGLPVAHLPAAEQLALGLQLLIAAARERGVKLLLGTLPPFAGSPAWTEDKEREREALNRWIRGRQDVEAVVDFDAALRDPAQPQRLRADFDGGDHLHPNAAGLAAMADAVSLDELRE